MNNGGKELYQALAAGLACLLVASILAREVSNALKNGSITVREKGRGSRNFYRSSSPITFWYQVLGRMVLVFFLVMFGIAVCMHAITGS